MAQKRISKLATKAKSAQRKRKYPKGLEEDPLDVVFKTNKYL